MLPTKFQFIWLRVTEEKINIWKIIGRQTGDAKWWQKLTLPLVRWAKNVSFECPNIHDHISSNQTHCDTIVNVRLDLHYCCYSIYMKLNYWWGQRSLVEQELLTLTGHLSSPPVFSGDRVVRSLVLYVCFVDRCLSLFFRSICCLFFFDIQILIAPLVSPNSSYLLKLKFVSLSFLRIQNTAIAIVK